MEALRPNEVQDLSQRIGKTGRRSVGVRPVCGVLMVTMCHVYNDGVELESI